MADESDINAKGPEDIEDLLASEEAFDSSEEADGSDDGLISLDDIDSIIAESDPDFKEEVSDLEKDSQEAAQQAVNVEPIIEEPENSMKERSPKLFKVILALKTLLLGIRALVKRGGQFLKQKLIQIVMLPVVVAKKSFYFSIYFVKNVLPAWIKKAVALIESVVLSVQKVITSFVGLPLKKKLLFMGFVGMFCLTVFAGLMTTKGIWIPFLKSNVTYNFHKKADKVYALNPDKEWLYIQEVFQQPEFTILLNKMKVSLKRIDPNTTPMAAFEIYVTLDSQEAAVEVKDREKEILDLIQRIVEEMTSEELNQNTGIFKMKTLIKNELNTILNMGKVRAVLVNLMIIKDH